MDETFTVSDAQREAALKCLASGDRLGATAAIKDGRLRCLRQAHDYVSDLIAKGVPFGTAPMSPDQLQAQLADLKDELRRKDQDIALYETTIKSIYQERAIATKLAFKEGCLVYARKFDSVTSEGYSRQEQAIQAAWNDSQAKKDLPVIEG